MYLHFDIKVFYSIIGIFEQFIRLFTDSKLCVIENIFYSPNWRNNCNYSIIYTHDTVIPPSYKLDEIGGDKFYSQVCLFNEVCQLL